MLPDVHRWPPQHGTGRHDTIPLRPHGRSPNRTRVPGLAGTGTVPRMRHIGSLIAGIIAAPVAWLLIGWGQLNLAKPLATAAQTGTFHTNDFVKPFVILAVAGLVVGLVASLRLSPVGPLVAGAALVAPYIALLVAPSYTFRQF